MKRLWWKIIGYEPLRKWLWKTFFASTQELCRRSDVHLEIDSLIWENRDRKYIVRLLQDLQTKI